MDEVRPKGGFGKESFLRALVVQLSQAMETTHGPDAAEAAVAQVGVDVSWQMEEEFRHGRAGRRPADARAARPLLRAAQARHRRQLHGRRGHPGAIGLENTDCPFGRSALRAPALCRTTSSVFWGIAARNRSHPVSVLLEERIAVGDPACRVVVSLVPVPEDEAPFAHLYRAPVGSTTDLG